jgi:hypothetical protein
MGVCEKKKSEQNTRLFLLLSSHLHYQSSLIAYTDIAIVQ